MRARNPRQRPRLSHGDGIEDKRRAVNRLLSDPEWSHWSDREIARHCRVGADLVGRLRPAAPVHTVGNDSIPQARTFTHHKTGQPTTMAVGNIGRPAEMPSFARVTASRNFPVRACSGYGKFQSASRCLMRTTKAAQGEPRGLEVVGF